MLFGGLASTGTGIATVFAPRSHLFLRVELLSDHLLWDQAAESETVDENLR